MKISKQRLKEIIKEELNEASLKRFKVFVSGEKEPLILMGKNEKDVKQTAHMMIKNSSVKIRKVVKEGKLNEGFSSKKVDTKIIAKRMMKDKQWFGPSWAKALLKKYKRLNKYRKSNLCAIKMMDGTENIIASLVEEVEDLNL